MRLLILFISIVATLFKLGGTPDIQVREGQYTRIALTDSTTLETYEFAGDSMLVVLTACAPQCSSCTRVYNKEGSVLRTITPPFTSIFPLATIDPESGRIGWTDNDTWEY